MNTKLELIHLISNRLAKALAVLVCIFIPAAIFTYLNKGSVIFSTPMACFACGVIGGFVGLQRRLKKMPDDDLQLLVKSWVYIGLSPLVGGILAVVIYVMFISGLLAGDLFPTFIADEDAEGIKGLRVIFEVHGQPEDYAKLLFWCFIAGFSERFATDIISGFEAKAKKE